MTNKQNLQPITNQDANSTPQALPKPWEDRLPEHVRQIGTACSEIQYVKAELAEWRALADAAPNVFRQPARTLTASAPAPTNEEIFEMASPYFGWNAESWQKATEGRVGMPYLLEFTRTALAKTRQACVEQMRHASSDYST